MHKEKHFLLMTLDGIDFTYCSATADRTEPESLIHEFMTLTRLKIDCIRYEDRYIQGVLRQQSHHDGGDCCIYAHL